MKTNPVSPLREEPGLTSAVPSEGKWPHLAAPGSGPGHAELKRHATLDGRTATELLRTIGLTALSAAAFLGSYTELPFAPLLTVLYLFWLVQLARSSTWRKAFYSGLAVGMCVAAVKLTFFWTIFSWGAAALWLVYALWTGLFTATARMAFRRLRPWQAVAAVPVLWTGFEYFRSELYYLRFSWLSPGYAFGLDSAIAPARLVGVYGTGFLCAAVAVVSGLWWQLNRVKSIACLVAGAAVLVVCGTVNPGSQKQSSTLTLAGVQLEFPTEKEVIVRLNEIVRRYPDAQLLVLPEYSLSETVPVKIAEWCRRNSRYLVVCGKDPAGAGKFRNTAWVVGPTGELVFGQVKAVPIQFFKDGLAATNQAVWESPWGKLGICICYDLSYTRVTDELIRQGARGLIVPTMDVVDWGKAQHELHARIAPARAQEYGVPIFRVASSGVSQALDAKGRQVASAPFAGDGRFIAAQFGLPEFGRLPVDRIGAPIAVWLTVALVVWFCAGQAMASPRGRVPPNHEW